MPVPCVLTHAGVGCPNDRCDGPEAAASSAMNILAAGGDDATLRAVIEATVILEDDPRFNAGTGSNFRMDGSLQQDAIVATDDGRIGAVACIENTRNPIRVARLVMDTPHTMLSGRGAIDFARRNGHPEIDASSPRSHERLRQARERLNARQFKPTEMRWADYDLSKLPRELFGGELHGTVGAVARDQHGRFAVACSTGGTSMMMPGRIGDSPIFGAGVMVGPAGAVCATGDGEEILRRLTSMRAYLRIEAGEHPQAVAESLVAAFSAPWELGLIIVNASDYGMAATGDVMARAAIKGA